MLGSRLIPGGELHYGYWDNGLEPTWANLPVAQSAYSDFLLRQIPPGVSSILDVGIGTGGMTRKLLAGGYRVEGVSPSAALTALARERLGESVRIHLSTIEALRAETRYDLVLFSESFQYIPVEKALSKAHQLLLPGGWVLICDFFKTEAPGRSPVGGGHRLSRFYEQLGRLPFTVVEDRDITPQVAPTIDLMGSLLRTYGQPVHDILSEYFRVNHPWISRLVRWTFGRKIDKIRYKLFSGQLTAESFSRYRSYRLFLLRKR